MSGQPPHWLNKWRSWRSHSALADGDFDDLLFVSMFYIVSHGEGIGSQAGMDELTDVFLAALLAEAQRRMPQPAGCAETPEGQTAVVPWASQPAAAPAARQVQ